MYNVSDDLNASKGTTKRQSHQKMTKHTHPRQTDRCPISFFFHLRHQEQDCVLVLCFVLYSILQNPFSFYLYSLSAYSLYPKTCQTPQQEALFFEMTGQEFVYWDAPLTFSIERCATAPDPLPWWHASTCRHVPLHYLYTLFQEIQDTCRSFYPFLGRLFQVVQNEMETESNPERCSFCTTRRQYATEAFEHYRNTHPSVAWESLDRVFPFPLKREEAGTLLSFETHLLCMEELFSQCSHVPYQSAFVEMIQQHMESLAVEVPRLVQGGRRDEIQSIAKRFKRAVLHFFDEKTRFVKTKHMEFDAWFMALYDLALFFSSSSRANPDPPHWTRHVTKAIVLLHLYFLKPIPLSKQTQFYILDASQTRRDVPPVVDYRQLQTIHPFLRGNDVGSLFDTN